MSEEKSPKADESAAQATWLDSPTVVLGKPTSNQIRSEPQFKELPPEREALEDLRIKQAEILNTQKAILAGQVKATELEPASPRKKARKRLPRPATAREQAILKCSKVMGRAQYCLAVGLPLRAEWGPRPNGEKTIRDAYESKNEHLLELIKSERKNAWKLHADGVI